MPRHPEEEKKCSLPSISECRKRAELCYLQSKMNQNRLYDQICIPKENFLEGEKYPNET